MNSKVLLIEDAEEIRDLVRMALGQSVDLNWSSTLQEASRCLETSDYDIILLDVGLPDGDGFNFFSILKSSERHKNVPVVFLTARDSDPDKVLGITLGADDYIVKPFSSLELRARVEMRIKKNRDNSDAGQVFRKGELEVNLAQQRAFIQKQNEKIDLALTTLEFKILVLLLKNEENVFSRDKLLTQVWGENTYLTDRCIDTHIYSLRKKLGDLSPWIQSVYGQGYRLSRKTDATETTVLKKSA